jgi:hypothetical protein
MGRQIYGSIIVPTRRAIICDRVRPLVALGAFPWAENHSWRIARIKFASVSNSLEENHPMSAAAKIQPVDGSNPDLDAIVSDLAALRRDLAALTDHLKIGAISGAKGAARDAAGHLGDEVERLYGNLAAQGERSMKALGRQVEEQPIMSLLLAFALGFAGSRLLAR